MNAVTQPANTPPSGVNFRERAFPAWPWSGAVFLLLITVLAYLPVITSGGFIWDDDSHVTANVLLRSFHGLQYIWTRLGPVRGGTCQYYPLTFSAFWVEFQLFRYQPLGYHLVNILLHALNAVLVWRILRRLEIPGALLAAAIFAIHPVYAESVAWVTELKNILSGLCYLASLLFYLRFLEGPRPGPACGGAALPVPAAPGEGRGRPLPFYFLSISLFFCALAGKTATVSLPVVILCVLWWKNGRVGRRDLLLVSPMLALAACSGLVTVYIEKYQVGALGAGWALTPLEHILLAGRILCFYFGKLVWPAALTFIYPRWEVSQAAGPQYLFPAAVTAVLAALWLLRNKIGRGPLAAALVFIAALAPVLGFINVYFMQFSFVADHFRYLADLGFIALFSAAGTRGCLWLSPRGGGKPAAIAAAAALLLALGLATWRQGGIYKNADRVWADTIKKNPACWMAHNNFGISLAGQGKAEEAIAHYREALRLKPGSANFHNNWGIVLAGQGKAEEAIAHYREAARLKPDLASVQNNWGLALAGQGKAEEAIAHYRESLRLKPDLAEVHNNWGRVLEGQGKAGEAAAHYREALRLKPDLSEAHYNLAVNLARHGKAAEALPHYREAIRIKIDPQF